ncbi:hypothetical protein ATANTOWER_018350 [Ataeniobius toweri]|uniref:Uncharacterized protein n=1 Tax=Ataeniobius toweri TaxID=208326 RepID=A0ABU7AGD0_9TELE|nr:hypothetical protein [Ataeniobius toweri]
MHPVQKWTYSCIVKLSWLECLFGITAYGQHVCGKHVNLSRSCGPIMSADVFEDPADASADHKVEAAEEQGVDKSGQSLCRQTESSHMAGTLMRVSRSYCLSVHCDWKVQTMPT